MHSNLCLLLSLVCGSCLDGEVRMRPGPTSQSARRRGKLSADRRRQKSPLKYVTSVRPCAGCASEWISCAQPLEKPPKAAKTIPLSPQQAIHEAMAVTKVHSFQTRADHSQQQYETQCPDRSLRSNQVGALSNLLLMLSKGFIGFHSGPHLSSRKKGALGRRCRLAGRVCRVGGSWSQYGRSCTKHESPNADCIRRRFVQARLR